MLLYLSKYTNHAPICTATVCPSGDMMYSKDQKEALLKKVILQGVDQLAI